MSHQVEASFDTIQSAHDYITLLSEAATEAKRDIDDELALATSRMLDRRVQALRVVAYNLEKLQRHLSASGRTLNDLRSLRRLLFEERPGIMTQSVDKRTKPL